MKSTLQANPLVQTQSVPSPSPTSPRAETHKPNPSAAGQMNFPKRALPKPPNTQQPTRPGMTKAPNSSGGNSLQTNSVPNLGSGNSSQPPNSADHKIKSPRQEPREPGTVPRPLPSPREPGTPLPQPPGSQNRPPSKTKLPPSSEQRKSSERDIPPPSSASSAGKHDSIVFEPEPYPLPNPSTGELKKIGNDVLEIEPPRRAPPPPPQDDQPEIIAVVSAKVEKTQAPLQTFPVSNDDSQPSDEISINRDSTGWAKVQPNRVNTGFLSARYSTPPKDDGASK
jgi:hypothetical protein